MSELYLVSCVGNKNPGPAPAKDLYTGTWFSYARCHVEKLGHRWFILSAKHRLVEPDRELECYDCTLNGKGVEHKRAWAAEVFTQLKPHLAGVESVTFLAGRDYYEFLVEPLRKRGLAVSISMEHMKQGKQLQWLKEQCDA